MGRYDGDDRAERGPCRPTSSHQFGFNGTCHVCNWTRDSLVALAADISSELKPKPKPKPIPAAAGAEPLQPPIDVGARRL